jgi:hypothetical protein
VKDISLGSGLILSSLTLLAQEQVITEFRNYEDQFLWHLDGLGYATAYDVGKVVANDTKVMVWDYDLNLISEYVIPKQTPEGCDVLGCAYNGQQLFLHICYNGIVVMTPGEPEFQLKGVPGWYTRLCPVSEGCVLIDNSAVSGTKYGVELNKVDESLDLKWTRTLQDSKATIQLGAAEPVGGQLALVTSRYSGFSFKGSTELTVISAEEGKTYYSVELDKEGARGCRSLYAHHDGSIFVSGTTFKDGKSDDPDGVFFIKLDIKGAALFDVAYSWADLAEKWTGKGDPVELDGLPVPVIQGVWMKPGGHVVLVLETFDKIARRGITGTQPATISDMLLMELDASGNLLTTAAVNKPESTCRIPTKHFMDDATNVRAQNAFDFIASRTPGDSVLIINYLNKGTSPFVGTATVTDNLEIHVSKHSVSPGPGIRMLPGKENSCLLYYLDEKNEQLKLWVEKW